MYMQIEMSNASKFQTQNNWDTDTQLKLYSKHMGSV